MHFLTLGQIQSYLVLWEITSCTKRKETINLLMISWLHKKKIPEKFNQLWTTGAEVSGIDTAHYFIRIGKVCQNVHYCRFASSRHWYQLPISPHICTSQTALNVYHKISCIFTHWLLLWIYEYFPFAFLLKVSITLFCLLFTWTISRMTITLEIIHLWALHVEYNYYLLNW